jgi:3-hydroxyacyl-CoA dehydrogenase
MLMPADPENMNPLHQILTYLGLGGVAAGAIGKTVLDASSMKTRMKAVEQRTDHVEAKVDTIEKTLAKLDERSERAEEDRKEMLSILRNPRV